MTAPVPARAIGWQPAAGRLRPVASVVALALAVIVLALLWVGVASGTLLATLDPGVDAWVVATRPEPLVVAARIVSEVGQPAVMIAVMLLGGLLIARAARSWWPAVAAAVAAALLAVADNGVKVIVARPRPPLAWHAMSAQGLSFPSGHALWSAGAALLLVLLLDPRRHAAFRMTTVLAVVVAVAVAASRIVVAVHYPGDVLAGWCLAVLADGIAVAVVLRVRSSGVVRGPAIGLARDQW
ncbi:phosphatase PAP2 family protein [Actinomycetospora soli]|uniref:phosphatase PAP2 family protein n=1 Tax=Actinomycetospora soli TaxID=2893887 RepID=UPI001E33090E|nr:phosphatase PAP2 family protein [Actinomycetospora soli]MCD2191147.1 phosphatase PAP2 family protein [Actinomycetospora soli]